ncbi:hypothetical protein M8C21_032629 [Ambrosia artemisiifolia]|uniref:CUE domain-containing protein n=1 Tax=Ambrosia artemisiifolia TaxID=4212 RepID=A0AAD5GU15_AMBAR|nr:hypothetical protein M8C21_032629 [Ambrosia artemisiifolia]
MGSENVFRVLQELFPKVDSILLQYAALQHPYDADSAAEVVLTKTMDVRPERPLTIGSSSNSHSSLSFSNDGIKKTQAESSMDRVFVNPFNVGSSSNSKSSLGSFNGFTFRADGGKKRPVTVNPFFAGHSNKNHVSSMDGNLLNATKAGSSSNSQSSSSFFDGTTFRTDGVKTPQVASTMDHVTVNPFIANHSTKDHVSSIDGSSKALDAAALSTQFTSHTVGENVSCEPFVMSVDDETNSETEAKCDGVPLPLETFGGSNSITADSESIGTENVDNEALIARERKQLVGTPETNLDATQESDPICSTKTLEKDDLADNFANSEDESAMSSVVTRSEQVCSTEYLDEVIEDAKNKKETFELAMNSVIDLMKAVESKEQDAEQANENATRGCSDILAKVDEVKHALVRAKETNDMHAGEVNAERAILATEMRELQVRLFNLSDERNKSLEILEEMRKALDIRMAAALEEIATAEDKKLERERSAKEALLYQESQMEKVVEESKKLKLVAEENSKLQEFITDRGHVIDILQGEMAVKCQDVLLLKEKFDKRIPLTGSLFASQASSILVSPSSPFRSTTPLEHETETLRTPKSSSLDGSPKSPDKETASFSNGKAKKDDDELKGLLGDDGWELFNNNGDLLFR